MAPLLKDRQGQPLIFHRGCINPIFLAPLVTEKYILYFRHFENIIYCSQTSQLWSWSKWFSAASTWTQQPNRDGISGTVSAKLINNRQDLIWYKEVHNNTTWNNEPRTCIHVWDNAKNLYKYISWQCWKTGWWQLLQLHNLSIFSTRKSYAYVIKFPKG